MLMLLDSLPTVQQQNAENGEKIMYYLLSSTNCKTHDLIHLQASQAPSFWPVQAVQ